MKLNKLFIILSLLLIFVLCSCDNSAESPTSGLSTPSHNNGGEDKMTNTYEEEIFSDSELEEKVIEYSEKYRPQYHYSPKKIGLMILMD